MRALCWHGKGDVRVDTVPDPKIQHPRDAVIKITACAICGSDLHLLDGYQPTMESGDILGHENMGEVIELGSEVKNLKIGDRVVVPFTISCGQCWFCERGLFSCCDRTNPNAEMAAKAMGQSPAGLFGFSHMLGGYAGGQAEFLRVPMADVGPIKVPDNVTDEQALFLSDIFPTGYMAAVNAQIEPGDTVAIWGCGPVGQFAIRSALLLGAGLVIAIDEVSERLAMAEAGGAETIDFSKTDVYDELMKRTNKRGPDSCIDAVGCEASGHGAADAVLDKVKAAAFLATDRVHVLRQAIMCCRKAGTVSIPGVYVGMGDKIPFGAAMNKGLTIKTGQTHVQAYTKPLMKLIQAGDIDPSFVVTHPASLEDAPAMYKKFRDKEDGVIKVVLRPGDRVVYAPGDSLLVATRRHVAKSTLFVLLGSPELAISRRPLDWVEHVDFGRTVSNSLGDRAGRASPPHPILRHLSPFLRLDESPNSLAAPPSDQVLGSVRRLVEKELASASFKESLRSCSY